MNHRWILGTCLFISLITLKLQTATICLLESASSSSGLDIRVSSSTHSVPLDVPHGYDSNSVIHVLRPNLRFIANDIDSNLVENADLFPPVTIVHDASYECKVRWGRRRRKKEQFLQEVGFIKYFTSYYPRTSHWHIDHGKADEDARTKKQQHPAVEGRVNATVIECNSTLNCERHRFFIPLCPMTQGKVTFEVVSTFQRVDKTMGVLQVLAHSKRVFFVSASPGGGDLPWEYLLHNARALRIDQTSMGFYNDIMIPISRAIATCNYTRWDQSDNRTTILYSCGKEHPWSKRYKGYRHDIPRIFRALNKTDIDVSEDRSVEDYSLGFGRSKFCLIVPGDTTSTSQHTCAMCQACVPIFLAQDVRELPFSNILDYRKFSLRFHGIEMYRPGAAIALYNSLHEMVRNGTYAKLQAQVRIARDFFNYHQFGSRSPYAAALLSMWQDEQNELQ